jgi:hypothetical protein
MIVGIKHSDELKNQDLKAYIKQLKSFIKSLFLLTLYSFSIVFFFSIVFLSISHGSNEINIVIDKELFLFILKLLFLLVFLILLTINASNFKNTFKKYTLNNKIAT